MCSNLANLFFLWAPPFLVMLFFSPEDMFLIASSRLLSWAMPNKEMKSKAVTDAKIVWCVKIEAFI